MEKKVLYEHYTLRKKVNPKVFTMADSELLKGFLSGDRKLLGDFLIGPCYAAFCSFSKKFYSLRLEPDEIVSIACVKLLSSQMSLLRNYKADGNEETAEDEDDNVLPETAEEKQSSGLRRYVIRWTRKSLGKILSKELNTVGTGEGKAWKSESGNTPEKGDGEKIKKPRRLSVCTGQSYSLDSESAGENMPRVKELLAEFNTSAVDLNLSIAKLPLIEQRVFILCSINGYSAKVAAEKLGLSARQVYLLHSSASESIKEATKR